MMCDRRDKKQQRIGETCVKVEWLIQNRKAVVAKTMKSFMLYTSSTPLTTSKSNLPGANANRTISLCVLLTGALPNRSDSLSPMYHTSWTNLHLLKKHFHSHKLAYRTKPVYRCTYARLPLSKARFLRPRDTLPKERIRRQNIFWGLLPSRYNPLPPYAEHRNIPLTFHGRRFLQ